MKKEIKFNIGNKVCIIDKGFKLVKCSICNGKGAVKIKGKSFKCPECEGDGETYSHDARWHILNSDCTIEGIYINMKNAVSYDIDYRRVREENIFLTKKEAQAECKRRNNEK